MSHFTVNNKFKSLRVHTYRDEAQYGLLLEFMNKAERDAKYQELKKKYVKNLSKFSTVVPNIDEDGFHSVWCITYGG